MLQNEVKMNSLLKEQALLIEKLTKLNQEISALNDASKKEPEIKNNQLSLKVRRYNPYSGKME